MSPRLLIAVLLWSLALAPALAGAGELSLGDRARASEFQNQAVGAAQAGRWGEARSHAEKALRIDPSPRTVYARQVLIRALEELGRSRAALSQVESMLALQLLDGDRAWALERQARLGEQVAAPAPSTAKPGKATAKAAARPQPLGTRKSAAIAMVVGGGISLGFASWFLGNDLRHAAMGTPSGGWALTSIPLFAATAGLGIGGAALFQSAPKPKPKPEKIGSAHPLVLPVLAPTPGGLGVGLVGTF